MQRNIFTTEDGSHTIVIPEMNEQYHSVHGAIQESNHVFIDAALSHKKQQSITIFEVGFGTGLNAYLSLGFAHENHIDIHYISVEKYPLLPNEYGLLNYGQLIYPQFNEMFIKMHEMDWDESFLVKPNFKLKKIKDDLRELIFEKIDTFDLIYFDAFGPDKHPDLWSQEIFNQLYEQCNSDAILVTYCAKGSVRRMIQQAGFKVERIPGPPGKREMIRGIK